MAITSSKKKVTRKLEDLHVTFYVRTELDQERVLQMAMLYEAGEQFPPLVITADDEILDGRHRKDAALLAGKTEHECVIADPDTPIEAIAFALKANEGGSKPPTKGDIHHAIRLMLQNGATETKLYELLPYPRAVTRRYIQETKSELAKAAMRKAKTAVADGMTVRAAADLYRVDIERLKAEISGVKKGQSGGNTISSVKLSVSLKYKSLARHKQSLLKRFVTGFIDNEVREADVEALLAHIDYMDKRHMMAARDWRNRFEAARRGEAVNWQDLKSDDREEFGGYFS